MEQSISGEEPLDGKESEKAEKDPEQEEGEIVSDTKEDS